MLTPEQISALRDAAGKVTDPVNQFLIDDIARRIAAAGQLTSTAAYQIWRAQQLGISQREIKKQLQKILGKSSSEIERLLTQSAKVGYEFDIKRFPSAKAVEFAKNESIQQVVTAAVQMAQKDFSNLTQTLGMVDPYGKALPLREAYQSCMDFAFKQVFTGAADYNTAIRRTVKNIADKGVRTIDYENGRHVSLEAAARLNIMGGIGLMQERISKQNHDALGANGWEISAHAASAPDHEPIQGRQYSDADYEKLNGCLARPIGTLNCGHAAFPIILGVSQPQYTQKQLRKFREDNESGVTYQSRHYTMYEATQLQRKVERSIRLQKNRILADEATNDSDKLLTDRVKLVRLNDEYQRFSKASGLRTQTERAQVAGFGRSEAAKATSEAKAHYAAWSKSIGADDAIKTLANYYDVKYNDSPRYELLMKYAKSVDSGRLSPITHFDVYERYYSRIQSEVVGMTTAGGIKISGQTSHFMERIFGTAMDPKTGKSRNGVEIEDVVDCLKNPVAVSKPVMKENGKRSILLTGKHAKVSVNPDTGELVQTNPWSVK